MIGMMTSPTKEANAGERLTVLVDRLRFAGILRAFRHETFQRGAGERLSVLLHRDT
jgi:hypothetical protein